MSGASALAAAKRRRAVPTETSRPSQPKVTSTPVQNQSQSQSQNQLQTPIAAQNPLALLLQHEQKLNDLEKNMTQLKVSDKKSEVLTPDTLQYFKTQHELMSQELQELKKVLIKVQSFSMETNLDVLKLKQTIKGIDSNVSAENVIV
jgi:tRNA C32,U32 (ribose-2'-O)-methylase TrmJ